MKHEKLIYGLGSALVIVGAVMKILHLPYGSTVILIAFIATGIFQNWQVIQLKKRVKELESKLN